MSPAAFDALLEARIGKMRAVLAAKSAEYSTGADKLHNFKGDVGGLRLPESPPQVLWGFLRKHLQSLADTVYLYDRGGRLPSPAVIDEKIGDAVNYLVLLEALFTEAQNGQAK